MTFTPVRLAISDITRSLPTVVETSTNHNLTTGQVVRIHVPKNYGMFELNQKQVSITILTATTFSLQYTQVPVSVDVDSRLYNAFVIPSNPGFTAEVIPMGSGPTPVKNTYVQERNNFCDDLLGDATSSIGTVEQPF